MFHHASNNDMRKDEPNKDSSQSNESSDGGADSVVSDAVMFHDVP
ncbi:hypothetical protein PBI_CANTARE_43 [Brevibacterium phage Cantare]|uniref:Uncharacterized protein n=1 Tax=Brevibacterium phage Cantare TaxID=2338395 RepID=A0A3G3LZK6_9CAUD|nr:hypothetical protein PQD70_gp043 [Brevibacterium phage Cantare]AYQ99263.1 hypothetical protein PBI_CANTARE_43 [Brevibacterium phage Cantare]